MSGYRRSRLGHRRSRLAIRLSTRQTLKESLIWHVKLEHKNMPFILSHVYVSAKSEWKYAKNIIGWKKDVTLSHKIRLADTCFFRKASWWPDSVASQRSVTRVSRPDQASVSSPQGKRWLGKITTSHWGTWYRARKISAIYGIIFMKKAMWDLLQKIFCVKNWEKSLDK